jgi:hypothetical protein
MAITEPVYLFNVSKADNRRLVHILAALREHIEDEVGYVNEEDATDPRHTALPERTQHVLCAYLWNELANAMYNTDFAEAERLDLHHNNPWIALLKKGDYRTEE